MSKETKLIIFLFMALILLTFACGAPTEPIHYWCIELYAPADSTIEGSVPFYTDYCWNPDTGERVYR